MYKIAHSNKVVQPLARKSQPKCHIIMQTAWIQMRLRVTPSLIQIQAVWHSDYILINFEWLWSTLKIEADEKFV